MDLNEDIMVFAEVQIKPVEVNLEKAIQHGLESRLELRQREIESKELAFDMIKTKALNEFKGDIALSFGLIGDNRHLEKIYNNPTQNPRVAISFSVPIFDWGEKKARVKAQEVAQKINRLEFHEDKVNIELNIRQTWRSLENLLSQIKIAKQNVANAQRTYDLNLTRYREGDITGMDMNQFQTQLSNKKIAYTQALINYKIELLNLKMNMKYTITSLLLFVLLTAGCNNQPQNTQNDIATPVSVTKLKKGSISKLVNTTGTAQPTYGVTLNSEMSGLYKLQTNPRTGTPFKLGDIEDREYENGIAIDAKELSLEIAEQEQVKQKALYEKGGVTLSEMRNTEVKVTNARYDYENGKLNLEKMNVKAPFDGVIVDLPHYTSDVRIEQGKPIVGIMDYARMYMDINLPESAIGYVKADQPVYVTHYTLPKDTIRGVISELSPAISSETRTFKGKILIQNDGLKLRPGMFIKADIVVNKADSAIIIPKDVIQSNRRVKYVYIVEKNTALLRELKTGLEDDKNIQILEGLKENDNLVVKGFETLKENAKVKVQK